MAKAKLSKRDQTLIDSLEIGSESETIRNPYSGAGCELDATGVALYDFVRGCEVMGDYQKMQQGLTLFRKLYPDEYYVLLD